MVTWGIMWLDIEHHHLTTVDSWTPEPLGFQVSNVSWIHWVAIEQRKVGMKNGSFIVMVFRYVQLKKSGGFLKSYVFSSKLF